MEIRSSSTSSSPAAILTAPVSAVTGSRPFPLGRAADSSPFPALPGGDLLINGDPFFVNIFFTGGDPNGASFSGDWVSPVPEPSGFVLFGSGILALAGVFRRKLLL